MFVPISDGNFLNLLPLSKDHADNWVKSSHDCYIWLPVGFPIDFTWRKLARNNGNHDHMNAACCNVVVTSQAPKAGSQSHDHGDTMTAASLKTGHKYHLFKLVAALNDHWMNGRKWSLHVILFIFVPVYSY